MPTEPHTQASAFYAFGPKDEPEAETPGFFGALRPAFKIENDVAAVFALAGRPKFEPDPEFDIAGALSSDEFAREHPRAFVGTVSGEEFQFRLGEAKKEQRDREMLASAGWSGLAAAALAGLLSPTTLLPLASPVKGARGVAQTFGLASLAVGSQELVLQQEQYLRTPEETFTGIAAGTVLAGILGSAAKVLSKGEFDRVANGMAVSPGERAILPTTPQGTLSAASSAGESAGRLKSGPGVSALAKIGPVTRVLNSTNATASWFMAQLSTAGVTLERNAEGIASALGGTVEARTKLYNSYIAKTIRAVDTAFDDYFLEGTRGPLRHTRALFGSLASPGGKLNFTQFKEEVSRALDSTDPHPIPQVAKAAELIRKEFYTPFLDEAKAVGIFPDDVDLKGAESYLNRIYDVHEINSRPDVFIAKLAAHIETKLKTAAEKRIQAAKERNAEQAQEIADLQKSDEEIAALREQLNEELELLQEDPLAELADELSDAREMARLQKLEMWAVDEAAAEQSRTTGVPTARAVKTIDFKARIKEIQEQGGEDLEEFLKNRKALRSRLRKLHKARVVLEAKQARIFELLDKIDEKNIDALRRVGKAATKLVRGLDKLSDAALDKRIVKLEAQVKSVTRQVETSQKRAAAVTDPGEAAVEKLKADTLVDKLKSVSNKLEAARTLDREDAREALQLANEDLLETVNRVNNKRAARAAKLKSRAQALDPRQTQARIDNLQEKIRQRTEEVSDTIRERGADDFDFTTGKFNFSTTAKELARDFKDRVTGLERDVVGLRLVTDPDKRGPALARLIDINSAEISDFLERDVENLIRIYSRTMGPDIEIARTFGSPNAVEAWAKLNQSFKNEEELLAQKLTAKGADAAVVKKLVEGKPLTPAEQRANERVRKQFRNLRKTQEAIRDDLGVVLERLRHRRGVPEKPDGAAYRFGKAAAALNTVRLMGGVVVSSIPDIGRPVMKYGLLNTFRDGWLPLISNWKSFKMGAEEARAAAIGVDVVLASRAQSMFDIFDDVGRGTGAERGLQYLANNFGNIALFNQWTDTQKYISFAVVHAKTMRALDLVLGKTTGSAKKIKKETEFLASLGINEQNAGKIWEQMQLYSDEVNGVLWPNTAQWTDKEARRAYQAAMVQSVDDTITTPGVERPAWVDKNIGLRLLAQFRSFALSSTTKTVMAGLQQRDMAVVNGMAISLALGALSYYLYAVAAGGETYNQMLKAGPDKWADEAIDRSGLLAVLGEVRNIGERVPLVQDYVKFSEQRTTRRQSSDLIDAVLGPTAGLADELSGIIMGIDEPTQATLGHARDVLPFQNVFYLRRLLDQVEQSSAEAMDLPERRQ